MLLKFPQSCAADLNVVHDLYRLRVQIHDRIMATFTVPGKAVFIPQEQRSNSRIADTYLPGTGMRSLHSEAKVKMTLKVAPGGLLDNNNQIPVPAS